jgi:hypothetical protein
MKVVRVILNADHYPHRGWASTPVDQGNVEREAKEAVRELNSRRPIRDRIVIERLPLTDSHIGPFPVRPRDDDPEPPNHSHIEIPLAFHASDPGPEPVDDGVGCIAGRTEVYECQTEGSLWGVAEEIAQDDQAYTLDNSVGILRRAPEPGDFLVLHRYTVGEGERRTLYARRMEMATLVWGSSSHEYEWFRHHERPANVTYKQCPHCATFAARHEAWYVRMHGQRWGRGRGQGWRVYCEMIERFGDTEGWRTARREDYRRVRRERKEHKAWFERNHIPLSAISKDRDGLPRMRDGYVLRKDAEAYFLAQRNEQRHQQRQRREAERRERERRQIERFKRRVQRRLDKTFERTAQRVAAELATLRTINDSSEEQ